MTKCMILSCIFEKCANSVELHEIWYQVLFHLKEIFLCGAETKPASGQEGIEDGYLKSFGAIVPHS